MNKTDLINELVKVTGTKKEAQAAFDCIILSIATALKKKEEVTLAGFGTFKVNKRITPGNMNMETGERTEITQEVIPKFVAGKALRDFLK